MTTSTIPDLTEDEFAQLAEFVRAKMGLNLKPEKRALVQSRLTKRLRDLRLVSFHDYLDLLESSNSVSEMDALAQALTTNVTSFFRENHHFETLDRLTRTEFLQRLQKGEEIRIWSAGCSTGAEPYSIAMTLKHALPADLFARTKILATDLDTTVLRTAQTARYRHKDLSNLPDHGKANFFNVDTTYAQVSDDIVRSVTFKSLNLIENWPMQKQFHAVFCRNVMIYFDADLQEKLCRRFIEILQPGGYLFIGHSERIDKQNLASLQADGITTYRKLQ